MKRLLWDGALEFGFVDAVRVSGRSCGNEKYVDAIVNCVLPPGHRLRLRVELESELDPIDAQPSEERELEQVRRCLVAELAEIECCNYSDAAALAEVIEALVRARIARALRVHCDADHDDDE